jgi:hypothetical protein
MTPRSNPGSSMHHEFTRQLAERNGGPDGERATKRFKSYTPKGAKLKRGYVDRAAERLKASENDGATEEARHKDQMERIANLKAEVEAGRLGQGEFERQRRDILSEKASEKKTGLDLELLRKAREGHDTLDLIDVDGKGQAPAQEDEEEEEEEEDQEGLEKEDLDDALDQLEQAEVKPVDREIREKKGNMAPPPAPATGGKKTRDQILAELKALRLQQKSSVQSKPEPKPTLGPGFKKVGMRKPLLPAPGTSRLEIDDQGREVLIIVATDGTVKRKVRKVKAGTNPAVALPGPEKMAPKLGMEVPEWAAAKNPSMAKGAEEDEDDDIFASVGEYDPLAGLAASSDSSESSSDDSEAEEPKNITKKPDRPRQSRSSSRSSGEVSSRSDSRSRSRSRSKSSSRSRSLSGSRSRSISPRPDTKLPVTKPSTDTSSTLQNPRRNYFGTSHSNDESTSQEKTQDIASSLLSSLKSQAAKGKDLPQPLQTEDEKARQVRLQKLLQASSRDDEDMDLEFGGSASYDLLNEDEDDGKKKKRKRR